MHFYKTSSRRTTMTVTRQVSTNTLVKAYKKRHQLNHGLQRVLPHICVHDIYPRFHHHNHLPAPEMPENISTNQ